jgi:hypothetical protein
MLESDRALAKAEALFKKPDEAADAVEAGAVDVAPERRRRRIVRSRPSVPSDEGAAASSAVATEEHRSAREVLRLLTRKEPVREAPVEPAPQPVVRRVRRAASPATVPTSPAFQLEVEVEGAPGQAPELVVLVIRGKDMADALRSTHVRVEDWIAERRPGADWRMTAIELLPHILA